MRAISENLAERGREILGVARRDATHGLGDERAIGVVLVRGAPDAQHAAQRVVAVGLAPITQEIPDRIVAPARDLVSRVVGIVLRARAVDPDARAVPGQIVAIRLSRARILAGAGQALQAVVVIADGAGRGADALLELTQQRLTEAGEDGRVGGATILREAAKEHHRYSSFKKVILPNIESSIQYVSYLGRNFMINAVEDSICTIHKGVSLFRL